MNYIKWPLNSYGTFYGTVREYDANGQDIGAKNISTWGVFFVVRNKWSYEENSSIIFKKSVGTGITIGTAGSSGVFALTIQSSDVGVNPREYVYGFWVNESGTTWSDGTTQLKSIGTGIFEVLRGAKYGTT